MTKESVIVLLAIYSIFGTMAVLGQPGATPTPARMGEKEGWLSAPALLPHSRWLKSGIIEAKVFGIASR